MPTIAFLVNHERSKKIKFENICVEIGFKILLFLDFKKCHAVV